jgi:hypothetical protein
LSIVGVVIVVVESVFMLVLVVLVLERFWLFRGVFGREETFRSLSIAEEVFWDSIWHVEVSLRDGVIPNVVPGILLRRVSKLFSLSRFKWAYTQK